MAKYSYAKLRKTEWEADFRALKVGDSLQITDYHGHEVANTLQAMYGVETCSKEKMGTISLVYFVKHKEFPVQEVVDTNKGG